MNFELDERLARDSEWVADLSLSQLRLMNNRLFTWLILVPKVAGVTEIIDLNLEQQTQLLTEINLVSRLIKNHYPCNKLNIANLGNVVAQLHIHIVARCVGDLSWPGPVWGGPNTTYSSEALAAAVKHLHYLLNNE